MLGQLVLEVGRALQLYWSEPDGMGLKYWIIMISALFIYPHM